MRAGRHERTRWIAAERLLHLLYLVEALRIGQKDGSFAFDIVAPGGHRFLKVGTRMGTGRYLETQADPSIVGDRGTGDLGSP